MQQAAQAAKTAADAAASAKAAAEQKKKLEKATARKRAELDKTPVFQTLTEEQKEELASQLAAVPTKHGLTKTGPERKRPQNKYEQYYRTCKEQDPTMSSEAIKSQYGKMKEAEEEHEAAESRRLLGITRPVLHLNNCSQAQLMKLNLDRKTTESIVQARDLNRFRTLAEAKAVPNVGRLL